LGLSRITRIVHNVMARSHNIPDYLDYLEFDEVLERGRLCLYLAPGCLLPRRFWLISHLSLSTPRGILLIAILLSSFAILAENGLGAVAAGALAGMLLYPYFHVISWALLNLIVIVAVVGGVLEVLERLGAVYYDFSITPLDPTYDFIRTYLLVSAALFAAATVYNWRRRPNPHLGLLAALNLPRTIVGSAKWSDVLSAMDVYGVEARGAEMIDTAGIFYNIAEHYGDVPVLVRIGKQKNDGNDDDPTITFAIQDVKTETVIASGSIRPCGGTVTIGKAAHTRVGADVECVAKLAAIPRSIVSLMIAAGTAAKLGSKIDLDDWYNTILARLNCNTGNE